MRNVFVKEMLDDNETISDYLGKFTKVQSKFILVSGEIRLIKQMSETCQRLFALKAQAEASVHPDENEIATAEIPGSSLSNVIGSHMITVFNDAKRITLSGWSWPSRYVAGAMSNNYKHGRDTSANINLQYVTPVCHNEFLDCIVKSDMENLKVDIREALAISVRVDGSVDRTQDHNVFAMIQIVKKDATLATVCLGFDVPKNPGAAGYLRCLKNIVNKVLSWDEFFLLVISIVTDGESLNMGHLNGLVAKLRDLRDSSGSNLPFLSIWCVPHRTNLAWKSTSKNNLIASLLSRARKLSKHFHDSGKRTQKLKDVATQHGLSTPLRYPSFFAVRWIEFVYNLLNSVLRNWRASIKYFEAEKLQNLLNYWTQYDTLHALTFLTDVLGAMKAIQKSCQSDCITLIDVSRFADSLFTKLENFKGGHVDGGWEQLFLQTVVTEANGEVSFYGTKLTTTSSSRTRRFGISFTSDKRQHILQSMIQHLKMRLELDDTLLEAFEPFVNFSSATSQDSLELCHQIIAADLDEANFMDEYYSAADFLSNRQFSSTLDILQNLVQSRPDDFNTLKIVMARIVVTKPHSADVERLINVYNKFKTPDRSTISQPTLSDYLYVNTNMGPLEKFDPTPAVDYWLGKKKRHPKSNPKSHLQEWYNSVFEQPSDIQ